MQGYYISDCFNAALSICRLGYVAFFLQESLEHKPQGQLLAFYSEIGQLLGNLFFPEGGEKQREAVGSFPEDLRTNTASLGKVVSSKSYIQSQILPKALQRQQEGRQETGSLGSPSVPLSYSLEWEQIIQDTQVPIS